MAAHDPREALLAIAAEPDGDVVAGALWMAAEECAEVDLTGCLARVGELAEELRTRLGGATDPPGAVGARMLAQVLEDRLRLRPGPGADPRSHHLHTVLTRGAGIPIACAALWLGVGRRAGLRVHGIGLPGHFAVRVGDVLVDPQAGPEPLDEEAALRLVRASVPTPIDALRPEWLEPVSTGEILARMSRNLRACHAAAERWPAALAAADRCVALLPGSPVERRERGLLRFRVGLPIQAIDDLRGYLEGAPDARDRAAAEQVIARAIAAAN